MASTTEQRTNRMLLNAPQPDEEIRFAIVDNRNYLENAYIDKPGGQQRNNIYLGIVETIQNSLQAAFVNFGSSRHGFLPFKEIAKHCYAESAKNVEGPLSISDVLYVGQKIMVQVEKEQRHNKGAALKTQISLAGNYLVLTPKNRRAGGISRHIEGTDRDEIRTVLSSLTTPDDDMGVIIRTAGIGKSQEELQWELDTLIHLWSAIENAYDEHSSPVLIHQESDIVTRAVREYLREDIGEILIDNQIVYEKTKKLMDNIRPEFADRVRLYQDPIPLFTRYKIEEQLETAYQSEVRLPSGGSIVIEQTEAMVTIDVNSSRDTKGEHIEATAFNANYEAAIEVARQLRLRDLGGLIVVDFIDMASTDNQRQIVDVFQQHIELDKARVQYGRISKFGLLEVSRQRLRPSIIEANQIVCPRCSGQGTIRSVESFTIYLLRQIHVEAMKDDTAELHVQLPVDVATYLINEKRDEILTLEKEQNIDIKIIANIHFEIPRFKIVVLSEESSNGGRQKKSSYKLADKEDIDINYQSQYAAKSVEQPLVNLETPDRPEKLGCKPGLLNKLWKTLFPSAATQPKQKPQQKQASQPQQSPEKLVATRTNQPPRSRGRRRPRTSGNRNNPQARRTDDPTKQKANQHDSASVDSE
jgi:ribonuclease E